METSKKDEIVSDMFTISGKNIKFDGSVNVYEIEDIAHALSRLCRFNGHTPNHYSVAEHCVHMAEYLLPVSQNLAFEALMHDSHEAYTGDVITPIKQLVPDFVLLEHRISSDIMETFGVGAEIREDDVGMKLYIPSDTVHTLDRRMAMHEAGSMGMRFGNVDADLPKLMYWDADTAKSKFLTMYERLSFE